MLILGQRLSFNCYLDWGLENILKWDQGAGVRSSVSQWVNIGIQTHFSSINLHSRVKGSSQMLVGLRVTQRLVEAQTNGPLLRADDPVDLCGVWEWAFATLTQVQLLLVQRADLWRELYTIILVLLEEITFLILLLITDVESFYFHTYVLQKHQNGNKD
jgi:hypothetical protein